MRDLRPPSCLAIVAAALLPVGPSADAQGPATGRPAPSPSILRLKDGGFVPGELADSDKPGILRWRGTPFASPFAFDVDRVASVERPDADRPDAAPRDADSFELAGGDVLFGSLVTLDDAVATLDVPRLGRFRIRRWSLLRIDRRGDGQALIYSGPAGLAGWKEAAAEKDRAWHDASGSIASDRAGTSIVGDVRLPARAAIEIELSWNLKPDFSVSLGVDEGAASSRRAFRLETWDGDLVAHRETESKVDLAQVATLHAGAGRVHLIAYLDQERGHLLVSSVGGKILADLRVADDTPRVLGGIRLENLGGGLKLERLRVSRWGGEPPIEATADRSRIHRVDGSIAYGRVARYDADAKEYVVRDGAVDTRVPEARVASVFFSQPGGAPPGPVRLSLRDGTRIGGELVRVGEGKVWLTSSSIEGATGIPIDAIRSFLVIGHKTTPTRDDGRPGWLELDGTRLHGVLSVGMGEPGAGHLAWRPSASAVPASLRTGVSGRVVYKEPPPPAQVVDQMQAQMFGQVVARNGLPVMVQERVIQERVGVADRVIVRRELRDPDVPAAPAVRREPLTVQSVRVFPAVPVAPPRLAAAPAPVVMEPMPAPAVIVNQGVVVNQGMVVRRSVTTTTTMPARPQGRPGIYLRTGDVIPADVTKIDESGVSFKSSASESTFVPHDKVKAVVLAVTAPIQMTRSKRDRLLTLPRTQKGSPPTHLIRSTAGDYLRGRVVGLDDKGLRFESILENRVVPRDRVARIIWLHADERDPTKAPAAPPGTTRVQAVRSDGTRLTFAADRLEAATLTGKSDVLGVCRVPLAEVDRLLIGPAIEGELAGLAYQQWRLQDAPEPKSAREESGGASGTESPLVGKPAPDFELDLLGGAKYRLSAGRGKVVVLDFWATWCGPCLQAMPQVDAACREFRDRGVSLVAVNLQETPKAISAMLDRHKLDLTVALDRDGVVAEKYGATAIPQTVVIGPDGTVVRLFIGGGPRLGDELREALRALVPDPGK